LPAIVQTPARARVQFLLLLVLGLPVPLDVIDEERRQNLWQKLSYGDEPTAGPRQALCGSLPEPGRDNLMTREPKPQKSGSSIQDPVHKGRHERGGAGDHIRSHSALSERELS